VTTGKQGGDVSVILPVFNGQRYLAEAIESALAQTRPPLEILVVDDGSTDGSARVAQEAADRDGRIRCVSQSHAGIGAARNAGVGLAQGDYLAFLDADDVWAPEKLALQRAVFDRDPGVDLVFGHVIQFLSPELSQEQRRVIHCSDAAMPAYVAGTLLVSREVFRRVGPFDTALRVGEFLHWYQRAADLHLEMCMLPDVLLKRRIHASNQGRRERDARTDYARALKIGLDRRRKKDGDA